MHVIMGLGPWYRIGLSITNALLLVAIIETILTCNDASHALGYLIADYHYGLLDKEPSKLAEDAQQNPQWTLVAVVYVLQILADVMLWFAVIIKGNRHFCMVWVTTTIFKTSYAAFVEIEAEWGDTYDDGYEALQRIFSFLWGTVVFGFCIVTGTEAYFYLTSEEGRVKLSPVGQGICAIRDYYRETPVQLAVVLLISEIAINVHRCFHYPVTAYLMEAQELGYVIPNEWGIDISMLTIVINSLGLILLTVKNPGARKAWQAFYVIIILVHFVLLVYVMIDWSPVNIHPHLFNGFVFVSVSHLAYKIGILYTYNGSFLLQQLPEN